MEETHQIERELHDTALEMSKRLGGAPVVIIVAGMGDSVPRTMIGSTGGVDDKGGEVQQRMRDFLGTLEAAKQIVAARHLCLNGFIEECMRIRYGSFNDPAIETQSKKPAT